MSYYTSYETSLALREAGAEQGPQKPNEPIVCSSQLRICWNSDGEEKPWLGEWIGDDFSVRSWRLDEILEALPDEMVGISRVGKRWRMFVGDARGEATSPVEAAAACWLAVLRAKGKEE